MASSIPSKSIALASRFADFATASAIADRIAADDSEWTYGVQRTVYKLGPPAFVIAVYDDEGIFLGFL